MEQCELLNLHRSGLYYQPAPESEQNLAIMRLLDEQYYKTPFYGIRKLTEWLQNMDYQVNHKRVRRLMKLMGWKTLYRDPNTSDPDKQHKVYPYLLKGMRIWKRNQVWQIDITYVPMHKGFMQGCRADFHGGTVSILSHPGEGFALKVGFKEPAPSQA